MVTIFSTAKPFVGHFGMIQRNALKSWTLLHPDVEVILFGDEPGAAEACRDLGIRHEPYLERSRAGGSRADYMFRRVQEISRHKVLCYSNCDIVLMSDFARSLQVSLEWNRPFLMVGRRWDTNIKEPIDFAAPDWERSLERRAKTEGVQIFFWNIDYFAFTRGAYANMPALVVGRIWWDHWMMWNALETMAVVDASESVCAVHQNHDYSHHPQGRKGVYEDEDANNNFQLAGGYANMRTIEDATYLLEDGKIRRNLLLWTLPTRRYFRKHYPHVYENSMWYVRKFFWHPVLNLTRPLRRAIGLRKKNAMVAER